MKNIKCIKSMYDQSIKCMKNNQISENNYI